MSADALKAGAVAYDAFASKIRDLGAENDFQKFAASPENYDVLFLENDGAYYFAFRIRRYRGRFPLDGGLTFRVDKSSGKVSIAQFPEPASSLLSKATPLDGV
jgi:hypothetical protein